MPVLKRSAFNQGGDWVNDGQDQADQFNVQRQDQLNTQAYNRQQDQGNNDWRTQYALAQLGLQGEQMRGNREDRALDRQSSNDAVKAQYDYFGKRDASEADYRNKQFGLQERSYGLQEREAGARLGEIEFRNKERERQQAENDQWNTGFTGALNEYKPGGQFMGINDVDPEDVAFLKAMPRDTTRTAALQLLSQRQSEKRMGDMQLAERIGKLEASGDPAALATATKLRESNPRAAKYAGGQLTAQERPQRAIADLPSKQDVSAEIQQAIAEVTATLDQEHAGYGQFGRGTTDETSQYGLSIASDRAKRIAQKYGLRPDEVLKKIADEAGVTPGRTYANYLNPAALFGLVDSPREDTAESFRTEAAKRLMLEQR
jgi:hypothetical protein